MRVACTAQRAFDAFTRDINQWWVHNEMFAFTLGSRGTLHFEPGARGRLIETYDDDTAFVIGEILTWDPPHRLVLTWREASFEPNQCTEVQISFVEVGDDQTRVTVEHFGWNAIPQTHVARHGFPLADFQTRCAEWWQASLARLAVLTAHSAAPK